MDLLRQYLIVSQDCGDPCDFERAIEALSLVLPEVSEAHSGKCHRQIHISLV